MAGDIRAIANVRARALKYFDAHPNEIHPLDLTKVRNDDWTVERFVIDQDGKEEAATKALIDIMKWRKSFGLHERDDDWFPTEFYKVATLFPFTRDRKGNQMLFFRIKQHRRDSTMIVNTEKFIAHQFNKIDEANPRGKWCVIFDMTGAGLSSVDMSMCNFLVECVQYRFPRGHSYVLVYGIHWIMQQFLKLARTWMVPHMKSTLLVGSGDEIFEYATADALPTFIGGHNTTQFRLIPSGSKSAYDSPWLGVPQPQIHRLMSTVFKKQLDDADKEGFETAQNNDEIDDDIEAAKKVFEEERKRGVQVGKYSSEL